MMNNKIIVLKSTLNKSDLCKDRILWIINGYHFDSIKNINVFSLVNKLSSSFFLISALKYI